MANGFKGNNIKWKGELKLRRMWDRGVGVGHDRGKDSMMKVGD